MFTGSITRRDFLKLSSAALLGLFLPELHLDPVHADSVPRQGRVQATSLVVRDAPSFSGFKVTSLKRDNLIDIAETVYGGEEGDYIRLWHRIGQMGYIYSGWVQPVSTTLNPLVMEIPENGILGGITVPYADSLYGVNGSPSPGPRLYFASTHWFTALVVDQTDGSIWYKAYDAAIQNSYYTRPEWVHLFTPEEIAPLSPAVPESEKHIEIFLDRQLLLAYEFGALVYAARVSTGQRGFESPAGWFHTFHKRPTYHMFGGADDASVFDLPGVPWCSYLTESGVAIHGTYWHNDFGHTHSHGCINMAPADAQWIFRWTRPAVPYEERLTLQPGVGTRVRITTS